MKKKITILLTFFSALIFSTTAVTVDVDEGGWNTVSVSENTDWEAFDSECGVTEGPVTFNTDSNEFSEPKSTLKPEKGYFIKVEDNCEVEIDGESDVTVTFDNDGWNLVSVPVERSWEVFDEVCGVKEGPVTFKTGENDFSEPKTTLKPGKGYFIKVEENCEVEINVGNDAETPENPGTPEDKQINYDGFLYFWSWESDDSLVTLDEPSYDLNDGRIRGVFYSKSSEGDDRTIIVENLGTGDTSRNSGSGEYVSYPDNEGSTDKWWDKNQDGARDLQPGTVNNYEVKVKIGEEVVQQQTFEFDVPTDDDVPEDENSGGEEGGGEDSSETESCSEFSGQGTVCPRDRCIGTGYPRYDCRPRADGSDAGGDAYTYGDY